MLHHKVAVILNLTCYDLTGSELQVVVIVSYVEAVQQLPLSSSAVTEVCADADRFNTFPAHWTTCVLTGKLHCCVLVHQWTKKCFCRPRI